MTKINGMGGNNEIPESKINKEKAIASHNKVRDKALAEALAGKQEPKTQKEVTPQNTQNIPDKYKNVEIIDNYSRLVFNSNDPQYTVYDKNGKEIPSYEYAFFSNGQISFRTIFNDLEKISTSDEDKKFLTEITNHFDPQNIYIGKDLAGIISDAIKNDKKVDMATINSMKESRSNNYNQTITRYETELINSQNLLKELNTSLKNTTDKNAQKAINEKIERTNLDISWFQKEINKTKSLNEKSNKEFEIATKFAEELNSKDSYRTAGIDINNFMPKGFLEQIWDKLTSLF